MLLATAATPNGGPAAAQPWHGGTILGVLAGHLRALGVGDVRVITRPGWEERFADFHVVTSADASEDLEIVAAVAADSAGRLVIANADIVTHRSAIDGLLSDPRVLNGALSAADGGVMARGFGIRSDKGRMLSMGSPYHAVSNPNNSFLGIVKVSGAERGALAAVAERLANLDMPADDIPAILAVGLVRSGVRMTQAFLGRLYWARPLSAEELAVASEEYARVDEDRVLLDSAVKPQDGFFTTFFVSPYSRYIARWAARRGLTPNIVTTFSMLVGIAAAVAFAFGTRPGYVVGALLLQAAFTFDCVDGQLARYTRTFTRLGGYLDSMFDRGKEYVVFAGLAIGSAHAGDPLWTLAAAALTFQTVRHYFDFSYGAAEAHEHESAPRRPLEDPTDAAPAKRSRAAARATSTLSAWQRMNRLPGLVWVKRMLPFPIGERFAAISITAAVFTPRVTFIVLLAWGGAAAGYTFAGRLLRSIR